MDYLPVFLRVENVPVLVVGGGPVALRKTDRLLAAGAAVIVVAPEIIDGLSRHVDSGKVVHRCRGFLDDDLTEVALVVAATDDLEINRRVSESARARRVPVNVVDNPSLCTFIMPSIVDRSPVIAAVSTSGAAPVLARLTRARIDAILPANLGGLAQVVRDLRPLVQTSIPTFAARRSFWDKMLDGPAMAAFERGGAKAARETLLAALEDDSEGPLTTTIHLLSLPANDPDLLTLRAVQLLQRADLIVHDPMVSEEVLARARRDAERLAIGSETIDDGSALAGLLRHHVGRVSRIVAVTIGDGGGSLGALRELDAIVERAPLVRAESTPE